VWFGGEEDGEPHREIGSSLKGGGGSGPRSGYRPKLVDNLTFKTFYLSPGFEGGKSIPCGQGIWRNAIRAIIRGGKNVFGLNFPVHEIKTPRSQRSGVVWVGRGGGGQEVQDNRR